MNMGATTSAANFNNIATNLVASGSTKPRRKPGPKATEDKMERRREILEAERWTTEVTAKSVRCAPCSTFIQLDKRGTFYGSNWFKHKDLCATIKQIEEEEAEVIAISYLSRSMQHMI